MVRSGWFVIFQSHFQSVFLFLFMPSAHYTPGEKYFSSIDSGYDGIFCDKISSGSAEMKMNWCPLLIALWRHRHYKRMPTKKEPTTRLLIASPQIQMDNRSDDFNMWRRGAPLTTDQASLTNFAQSSKVGGSFRLSIPHGYFSHTVLDKN